MTDALAPWANLGMLLVVGGIVTLVLVLVAGTADGAPPVRRALPRTLGAFGALAAFVAGLAVAAWAVVAPGQWWFALLGWAVWIAGEVVVFALLAVVSAAGRRSVHRAT